MSKLSKPTQLSSRKHPKVIVIMPAYNAAKTLVKSYRKLPKNLIDQIILIDDASQDNTYQVAKKLPITVYKNSLNLGYGGNLKVCLTKALETGADVIIEYHPDNQYDPQNIHLFIDKALRGYDFAIGSRFIHPKEAIDNKMPLVKFIANRLMSFIDSFILGIELSEFHSGFRMYSRNMLEKISYLQNSDDYLFSFEVIVQAVYKRLAIAELPISCKYHPEMHTANLFKSTVYALGTFKTLFQYLVSHFLDRPLGPFKSITPQLCPLCHQSITRLEVKVTDPISRLNFSVYFCTPCQIGFTHPVPESLQPYYPQIYYSPLKSFFYHLLQIRRPKIIHHLKKSGKILDIGCGNGNISQALTNYSYTGIETPFSQNSNPQVKLIGVEGMRENASTHDFVTFWESFEHLSNPNSVLTKAYHTLKTDGYLIIECPNFLSVERNLFKSKWFHYDPPRHLFHFTPQGLKQLLKNHNFKLINQTQVFAPEYTPVGLAQSILHLCSPQLNLIAHEAIILLVIPLLPLTIPLTLVLHLLHGSPILLTIARKAKTSR